MAGVGAADGLFWKDGPAGWAAPCARNAKAAGISRNDSVRGFVAMSCMSLSFVFRMDP